jgi:hypothetical protein
MNVTGDSTFDGNDVDLTSHHQDDDADTSFETVGQ